jgi:putative transposase
MTNQKPRMDVRAQITSWPENAPRGAVAAFCREHGISKAWFYKIRSRAVKEGQLEAMRLKSTRPLESPHRTASEIEKLALDIRAELERDGWDHGPLSVAAKIRRMGATPPSRATLARIFSRSAVVVSAPRKRSRSSYKRFVYPAPNCCWQMDATDRTLADGTVVVIFQLTDDHSRLAVASLAASGETSDGAMATVALGIARHGVPLKLLTDNGAALNPTRRGFSGQLVTMVTALGVEAITGRPGKPTTQGKNERIHQTLHRYLDKQPVAEDLVQLQAQVDTFDLYYNKERPHQSLDGKTPQEAWDALPTALPPIPPEPAQPLATPVQSVTRTAGPTGRITATGVTIMIGREHAGRTFHVLYDDTDLRIYDNQGNEIQHHARPAKGTRSLGNGKPRGFMATRQVSTKS